MSEGLKGANLQKLRFSGLGVEGLGITVLCDPQLATTTMFFLPPT